MQTPLHTVQVISTEATNQLYTLLISNIRKLLQDSAEEGNLDKEQLNHMSLRVLTDTPQFIESDCLIGSVNTSVTKLTIGMDITCCGKCNRSYTFPLTVFHTNGQLVCDSAQLIVDIEKTLLGIDTQTILKRQVANTLAVEMENAQLIAQVQGLSSMSAGLLHALALSHDISERDTAILVNKVAGLSNQDNAEIFNLSPNTIRKIVGTPKSKEIITILEQVQNTDSD